MYQIRFTRSAEKQFRKLDSRYKLATSKALTRLAQNPQIGRPLGGELKGKWKLRFSRYRIIYEIENKKLIIYVMEVVHRKDAYR